jgi:hypothetical protein
MMARPLIPLPPEYEDSGHSSPALVTAGIDPTRAAPSVHQSTTKPGHAPLPAFAMTAEMAQSLSRVGTDFFAAERADEPMTSRAVSSLRRASSFKFKACSICSCFVPPYRASGDLCLGIG